MIQWHHYAIAYHISAWVKPIQVAGLNNEITDLIEVISRSLSHIQINSKHKLLASYVTDVSETKLQQI